MHLEKPKEYCGICGVTGGNSVLERTHQGLHTLQHRGQEAAGIMVEYGGKCALHKANGLIDQAFANIPANWFKKNIHRAISHVRYKTAGESNSLNAQPLMVDMAGQRIGIAHNGTICNANKLRKQLLEEGAIFQTSSDTELILHLMARSLMKTHDGQIWAALDEALLQLEGAFSLILLTSDTMVAVRDPHGFRPLSVGRFADGGYIVASETIAFEVVGAEYLCEVEPGEMVIWNGDNKMRVHKYRDSIRRAHCIFEHVYFSRPGSYVFGDSVYRVRKQMGRVMAKEAPVDADVVIPMPDSGMYAALGYAEESGLPFDMGLSRNHYVGRTFIDPSASSRGKLVASKLQPIPEALEGKRIILVEDSVVRGTTARARVHALRKAGAKEIHLRVSCPPHRFGCFFGIDFPEKEALIANKLSLEEIAKELHLDSIAYLSKEGMLSCVTKQKPKDYCCACFDGEYPVAPEQLK